MLWKEVPGFLDYEVSEHGDLRHGQTRLKPERTCGNGRKRFSLSKEGRVFRFKAAQLVALAFVGPRPFRKAEACHNDGFEHNDHYSNLRWDTHAGNMADKVKLKLQLDEHSRFPIAEHRRLSVDAARFLAEASKGA